LSVFLTWIYSVDLIVLFLFSNRLRSTNLVHRIRITEPTTTFDKYSKGLFSITQRRPTMRQSVSLLALAASLAAAAPSAPRSCECRNIPGDAGWPNAAQWSSLNSTVNGRLIATVPLAQVCHDPFYDEEACNAVREAWGPVTAQTDLAAEFLSPYFLNQTCVPQTDREQPCELGNYASYSVDVGCAGDVAAGLRFAELHNLRVTIKNTGHDFLGRSTGTGALSIWTHNLKSIDIIDQYNSSYHNGPAVRIGAGVTGSEAVHAAGPAGYRFLSGNCPSVGPVGGFTQGGGYGPLTGMYGLGADNVLEWEVVTAAGEHLIATPTQNQELYWAMSGGGAGTYAVALSLTVRLFPEEPVAAAGMHFNVTASGGDDNYWDAVEVFISHVQSFVDQGLMVAFEIADQRVTLQNLLGAHGSSQADLEAMIQPLVTDLSQFGLTPESMGLRYMEFPNFYELYEMSTGPFAEDDSPAPVVVGSRFFSLDTVRNNREGITNAFRTTTEDGLFLFTCQAFDVANPERAPQVADNGVTDGWRNVAFECFFPTTWSWANATEDVEANWAQVAMLEDRMENVILPAVMEASPGDGAYGNEGHLRQPDWQQTFFGDKYNRLREIKAQWDPTNLFYAATSPGSEAWAPDASGRLCRTNN
jgi:hypothetical protein